MTAMLLLDDTAIDNSCLKIAPASQRTGLMCSRSEDGFGDGRFGFRHRTAFAHSNTGGFDDLLQRASHAPF
jgi:hypothetical protein